MATNSITPRVFDDRPLSPTLLREGEGAQKERAKIQKSASLYV